LTLTATQTEDAPAQTPVEPEKDEEMLDAPWDDDDLGMGPYAG
jgi:hypothetical protein